MAVLSAAALAVCLLFLPDTVSAAEGEPAPRVEFAPLGAEPVDLESLRGRVVVLDFWATWCAPCTEQLRALERFAAGRAAKDVVVVAVSIDDDADAASRFLAETFPDAKFRAAHDPGSKALSSFGAEAIPAMFVIDRAGVVRATHFGPGGGDALAETVAALGPAPGAELGPRVGGP